MASNDIFKCTSILSFRLHQLHETIGDLVPLPFYHDVEYTGKCDGLRTKNDALIHVQTDVTI